MTNISHDIICATATPPGRAALSIIRVSGPGVVPLAAKMIPALKGIGPDDTRKLYHDFLLDSDGTPIDEITVIPYFAPKSYTAEDMVEIISHGGYAPSRAIIKRLTDLGARIADPGEFTKRAFLNGRISLSQAEAVAAAIDAKSELALKAAARNLHGELYRKISDIRGAISELLVLIEAEIDFSEEEIDKTSFEKIKSDIGIQLDKSTIILRGYDFGRGLNSGYKVAIIGKPNVGKSSLLNALLNRQRAIVTEVPGTTRDTLTEWIEIDGFPILLTDTAGLHESDDTVESMGQERTRDEIRRSDLVLFVIDSSEALTQEDMAIYHHLENRPLLLVANKIDIANRPNIEVEKTFPKDSLIYISAVTGAGLEELRKRLARLFRLDTFSLETALLATERQYQAMKKACDTLIQALNEVGKSPQPEIISVYLRETLDYLGELVGETTTEDILSSIFSRFCIGK